MIRLKGISLRRGLKLLLENADLTLNPSERIGLIGANGTGKSSLFGLLRGDLNADQGEVDIPSQWRMAHVAQETPALERAAIDYIIDGDRRLRELEEELHRLNEHSEAEAGVAHGTRIAELHAVLDEAGVYTVRSRAERLLTGLGFLPSQFEQPVSSFSGGWRMRLNLGQALMCPSDLLLLDEPTNHLDLDAILWLEDWLKRYAGTLVIISHDRDFLDGIVNVVVHLDDRKLKRYSGNYSSFEQQRAAQLVLAQSAIEKQARQRAHLQSFIDRFKAKATKAKQAQSRMKALARMEDIAPLRAAAEFSFTFREPANAPNPLLVLEGVAAGYPAAAEDLPPKAIIGRIDFSLQSGQRIGLLGVNGAGKSTLIKTIAGELAPLGGTARIGKGLVVGYFAQHQVDMLRHDESPLWHLQRIAPQARDQELRNFLGSFQFDGNMAASSIAPFSGGEKARLALALIVWQRPNLLLLDEPTNHLDLDTREALTEALAQFDGTLVLVSHDRHLLRATTDQFLIVADGRLQEFDGDLDDYRDWLFKTKLAERQSPPPGTERLADATATLLTEDRREQKRIEAAERQRLATMKKPIEQRIRKLEQALATWQAKKDDVDRQLADPAAYDAANKTRLMRLLSDQAECVRTIESLESEWMAEQEALDNAAGSI